MFCVQQEGEARKWRKKAPPQWPNKNNVIEMLNELIDELEGIEQQIAQQAVEHIHANEVGGRVKSGWYACACVGWVMVRARVVLRHVWVRSRVCLWEGANGKANLRQRPKH